MINCTIINFIACGSHQHTYTESDCINAAVCSECGELIENALGHTANIGICRRCGMVQNEALLESLNADLDKIMDIGNDLMLCVSNIPGLSVDEQYLQFQKADNYVESMKKLYAKIIKDCSDESELTRIKYQITLLENNCPNNLLDKESASLEEQVIKYQFYLQQMSSSFNYLSEDMEYLVGNSNELESVAYFNEVEEMPTPDSIIYGITYDSVKSDSGVRQYMYLLGNDVDDAKANYNLYLSAIAMNSKFKVEITDTYAYVTKYEKMVSAMMAGTDAVKGFFLIVSFQE